MSLDDLRRRLRERRQFERSGSLAEREQAVAAENSSGEAATQQVAAEARAQDRFTQALDLARAQRRQAPAPPEGDHAASLALLKGTHPDLHERFSKLDPWQLAAVLDDSASLLLRAQVGSGKTTVLVAKLLAILEVNEVEPEGIVVMTFTNKAAAEIKTRVAAALPGREAALAKLRIGTFHSLCRGLLRRRLAPEESGRSRHFALLDERGRLDLLREIVARDGLRIAYLAKLDKRLELLRHGQSRFGNMKRDDDIQLLKDSFEREKRARDLMDFDDLIDQGRLAAQALEPDERPQWIVVDEFQDTDPDQLALLEDWRCPSTRFFAVGDPDQVIYSWRGGSVSLFDEFARRFGGRELSLPRNYRSTETILDAARFVLGPLAASHRLLAAREEGRAIAILRHHDPVAEARHLADTIATDEGERSVGILVRTREQMEPIREQLEAAGLEVTLRERRGADDPLRDWFQAWIDWVASGAEAEFAARVLGDRQFGVNGLKGRKLAQVEGADLEGLLDIWLPGKGADRHFVSELAVRARESRDPVSRDPADLLVTTGLEHFLEPRSSRFESRRRRVLGFLNSAFSQQDANWLDALRDTLALGITTEVSPKSGVIELMTMHAAKGLEFDRVFISGANRGMIPLASSWSDPEAEAEERRLFFVAMTRARDDLEIGWFGKPPRASAAAEPSPWLDLIPKRLLRDDGQVRRGREATQPASPELGATAVEVPTYGEGVAVRHPRYGEGVVIAVADGRVRCSFGLRGERSFSLLMCPLSIID